jgi:hypothetical protein
MAQGTSTGKSPSRCSGCACTHEYATCCGVHTPQMPTEPPRASPAEWLHLTAPARAAGIAGGGGAIEDDGNTGIVRDRISLPVAMGGWGMHQWADLAPVAFLAGAAAALPSFIDRRNTKHTGNKESGAGKGRGSGSGAAKTRAAQAAAVAPALRGPQHRVRTHASPPPGLGRTVESREQRKTERSRTPLGRREWAAQQGATCPLAASPRPRSPGCGIAAGTPLRERFAHGEGSGHT